MQYNFFNGSSIIGRAAFEPAGRGSVRPLCGLERDNILGEGFPHHTYLNHFSNFWQKNDIIKVMKQNNFTQQTHFIGVLLSGGDVGIKGW